jgi:hypothetical protein
MNETETRADSASPPLIALGALSRRANMVGTAIRGMGREGMITLLRLNGRLFVEGDSLDALLHNYDLGTPDELGRIPLEDA